MSDALDPRGRRMAFYKDDMDVMEKVIGKLLREARAQSAMLVDKDGHMIMRQGGASGYDPETVSALVAGSFAATKEVAKMLGEEEFSILFHQGQRDSIQLSLVGDRVILAVVFDDRTTVGMVRLYADQVVRRLSSLFKEIADRGGKGPAGEDAGLEEGFNKAAEGQIDDVFKDEN